jgi:hypothetical protein
MSKEKILVIEDEEDILAMVHFNLGESRFPGRVRPVR